MGYIFHVHVFLITTENSHVLLYPCNAFFPKLWAQFIIAVRNRWAAPDLRGKAYLITG